MAIDIKWEKFMTGLYSYICDYYNQFIPTSYTVNLTMDLKQVFTELTEKGSISELSPELGAVAYQYKNYLRKSNNQ